MRRSTFRLIPLLAAWVLGPTPAATAAPSIVRVWPQYRTAESFTRIREYFNGAAAGGESVLRSRPGERAGYYFLVRLENPDAPIAGARIELSLILPGSGEARVIPFQADIPAGGRVFHFGVTGGDWPAESTRPVAWRLVLRSPAGAELAHAQSFLWSLPAPRAPEATNSP